jgi:hypothetical protein
LSRQIPPEVVRIGARATAMLGPRPAILSRVLRGLDILSRATPGKRFAALRSFVNANEARALSSGYCPVALDARASGLAQIGL